MTKAITKKLNEQEFNDLKETYRNIRNHTNDNQECLYMYGGKVFGFRVGHCRIEVERCGEYMYMRTILAIKEVA